MNNKEVKQLRGQVRQAVKELLPEILTAELVSAALTKSEAIIQDRLKQIDQRQKDILSYMLRNSTQNIVLPEQKKEVKNEQAKNTSI